jgi:uncharacterized membrane protein
MQPLVTPKPGRVPVSTYLLTAAAAAMLIPVFPMTGVSAVLSAAGLVMALREAPGRNRVIAIVLAAVLLVAPIGMTLMSLQTGYTEMGPPTDEPR